MCYRCPFNNVPVLFDKCVTVFLRTIYEKLADAFVDEIKEIYLQRCEEISPNIRYCAYNIGDESAINDLMQMRLKSGREDALTSKLDVSLLFPQLDYSNEQY